ncbi:MAG: sigma-70 family RNA polymerase sigma factor, partial [Jatrophihabitantaceae bacterium]
QDHEDSQWIQDLGTPGPGRDVAVRRVHELMLRAARHQVAQMYPSLPALGTVRIDDIINQAADDATVALLGKLSSFEGRSRFTTWAYKFGILHAAVEVRRNMWRHHELTLDQLPEPSSPGTSPEQYAEAADFSAAVNTAIDIVLTAHQRRVVLALLADNIPIDVLADRLGSTRNALYKTLHDARAQLRTHLTATGHLLAPSSSEVSS